MINNLNDKKQEDYHDQVVTKQELVKQTIEGKRFENCKFDHCQFDESTFLSCKFIDCEFIDCSLNNIKIINTSWNNVVFERCKMLGLNWTEARWPQIKLTCPIQFYTCDVSYSSFFALELVDIHIQECKAHDVDFREADLSSAYFISTDFLHSQFGKTNLSSADFSDAINYVFDPTQNNIKKATFSEPEVINLLHAFDIVIK